MIFIDYKGVKVSTTNVQEAKELIDKLTEKDTSTIYTPINNDNIKPWYYDHKVEPVPCTCDCSTSTGNTDALNKKRQKVIL